ncbi:cupin domain-containing protein [Niabella insulamsoli]|uniref:cupin domain-containing protein n=1 Tax=Niabella insulamsoli TaxID=3144874 RepID=UPI0031FD033E
MKPVLVRKRHDAVIDFDDKEYDYFYNPWHYHPELELTLIVRGDGQRFVGDNVENFAEGDLVLVGSNLPHFWRSDNSYYQKNSQRKVQAIVVKFLPDFVGTEFSEREEMKLIKTLIHKTAAKGIKLRGDLKARVSVLMREMPKMDETQRIIQLLSILYLISISKEYISLVSFGYYAEVKDANEKDHFRINSVLDYLAKNYKKPITLDQIAAIVHMNRNAFCRFLNEKPGEHS